MNQLIVILFIEIIFCCIAYFVSNGVFVNPTFLSFLVVTISTVFGLIGNIMWNVKISDYTILVVFIGFSMMLLAEVLSKYSTKRFRYKENIQCTEIKVNKTISKSVILVVVILTILYCVDILRAGVSLGSGGLNAIYAVKNDRTGTNVIIRQGVKIIMACAYVHTFLFVNNCMILRKRSFDNIIHIVPAICGIICSIFTSVRTDIFRILTAFIVDYCILLFQTRSWKRKSIRKFIRKVLPIVVAAILLMTALKFVVKGESNATSLSYNTLQYAAYYIGTPIVVLGSKLYTGIQSFKGNVFGETSFNQLWQFLQDIGLKSDVMLRQGSVNVWIDRSKRITANVDTIFGPPMIDFGVIGMAIYILVLYYLLNKFYFKYISRSNSGFKRNGKLVVFSYLATICSMSYYTNLINMFLSTYYIITLILIIIYYKFIIKKSVNSDIRSNNNDCAKKI